MTTPSRSHSQLKPRFLLLFLLLITAAADLTLLQVAAAEQHEQQQHPTITLAGCPDKCSSINIPFPFGMKPACFREGFQVNYSFHPPHAFFAYTEVFQRIANIHYRDGATRPYYRTDLDHTALELIDILVETSEARAHGTVSSICSTNITNHFVKYQIVALGENNTSSLGPIYVGWSWMSCSWKN